MSERQNATSDDGQKASPMNLLFVLVFLVTGLFDFVRDIRTQAEIDQLKAKINGCRWCSIVTAPPRKEVKAHFDNVHIPAGAHLDRRPIGSDTFTPAQ